MPNLEKFIQDAVGLEYDLRLDNGQFINQDTLNAYKLWSIQQQRIEENSLFIREYINNPILEFADGRFFARPLKGMIEFKGKMVYVTSTTCLKYDMSISVQEAMRLKRIVF